MTVSWNLAESVAMQAWKVAGLAGLRARVPGGIELGVVPMSGQALEERVEVGGGAAGFVDDSV